MSWAQNTYEKGNRQTCSTRLKSNLIIRADGFGEALPSTTKDGTTVYPDVQPGYIIEWSAKTESDGSGRSDRVTARLIRLNTVYLGGLINDATATNPDASQEQLVSMIAEMADPSELFSTVSSQTVNTGSDGTASGILPTAGAPPGPAMVLVHYGYSGKSERSDSAKKWDFWSGEILEELVAYLIAGAVCAAGVAAAGVTAGLATGAAVFGCSLAISMAVAFCRMGQQYAADAFGLIDTNNDGCTFPIGGHNHTYAIAIGGDDGAIQASSAAALTPQATESTLSRKPFPVGRVILLSSIAAAAVLLIASAFRGVPNDGQDPKLPTRLGGHLRDQRGTKHRVKISSEEGSDGITKIKIRFKATDTSGAFSSSYSKGDPGHSIKIDIRYTPPAEDGGESRNIVTGETLGYVPLSGSYAEAVFDAIQPGTYNVTVRSRAAGGDCCKPGGFGDQDRHGGSTGTGGGRNHHDPLGQVAPQKPSPNPVVVGIAMFVGLVAIGIAFMDDGGDEDGRIG